jgi:hypothetical protein
VETDALRRGLDLAEKPAMERVFTVTTQAMRDVTIGPRQIVDEPCPQCVPGRGHDDRNRPRCDRSGLSTRRGAGDDEVHVLADKLGGEPREPLRLAGGPPIFDHEVSSLDVPVLEKGLPKPLPKWLRDTEREDADARGFPGRLSLNGERRGNSRRPVSGG